MAFTKSDPKATKLYRDSGCNSCPYCNSDNLNSGEFQADGTSVWRDVECEECNKGFQEVFSFSEVLLDNGE